MKPRIPFLEPRRPPCSLTRVPFEKCLYKPPKGILSEVNTGDPYMYMKVHLDGQEEVVYHVNLIDILDRVFVHDGMRFLSKDQERFFTRFIEAAGIINTRYDNKETDLYADIDNVFVKLDHFLGNYEGVDENEYTR